MKPTQEYLREIFSYDPITGVLLWAKARRGIVVGARVGHVGQHKGGYYQRNTKLDGKYYQVSHIIWCYMTGEWPVEQVDHENLDSLDDAWGNLRLATSSQNCANRRGRGSSWKGVSPCWNKWTAVLARKYLGLYDCPAAASLAYQIEADKRYGEFARW